MTRPNSGRYFEDFDLEETFVTAGRTITEADIVNFSGISGDFAQIHTNEQYAQHTFFGQRVAHGLLVLAVASGLRIQTGMYEGTLLALLGLEEWRFNAPVFIGDTVHVRMQTVEKRLASQPGRGIIKHAVEVMNQHGETVQTGRVVLLMRTRPDA
ncbi:MAG: MaoC/PaaZ C-terminal domain-containing protein [Armatimonadota bacterium]|nr:MaoC/PaaZ C-terminal domain-containing protein [Armatimonadota bacterium]